jgi:hypothetical protein
MKYTNKINISSQPHSYTLYYTKKDNHIYIKILKNEFIINDIFSEDFIDFLIYKNWSELNINTLRDKFYNGKRITTIFIK